MTGRLRPAIGIAAAVFSAVAMPAAAGETRGPETRGPETRGYVISWFFPSVAAQTADKDCPHGMNPNDFMVTAKRDLLAAGRTPAEVAKLIADKDNQFALLNAHKMRGRIGGKPADAYLNPTSAPDPKLKVVEGKYAIGFNLDGDEKTGGFINPETGERGVDNQLFRALGCNPDQRADPGVRPSANFDFWGFNQQQMRAWLIEVSGIDDPMNDPDVTVRISEATTPVALYGPGLVHPDMTFQEDSNPVTKNVVHGAIKDGVLTTDVMPTLNLNGHRWLGYEQMRWTKARIRLKFLPDGSLTGVIGGYHNWARFYTSYIEELVVLDYYSLRNLADADFDPKLGFNTSISTAFTVEAVPAFIRHAPDPAPAKVAAQEPPPTDNDLPANPPGITIRVIRIGFGVDLNGADANQPRDRTVFADEGGWTLYTSDADPDGKSVCDGDCAKTWKPALADADAKPAGYWSIVTRADGSRQWAFRGKPVYTYVSDVTEPQYTSTLQLLKHAGGEGKGQDIDGHHVLEILPEQWVKTPAGIMIREVRAAPGFVLTDDHGLPLYAYGGKEEGPVEGGWTRFAAPRAALGEGDFTVLTRPDGFRQWAYKGKPLYRFAGDIDYGDANGIDAGRGFRPVYILRYFMPQAVATRSDRYYGGLLELTDGTTLYARETTNGTNVGVLRGDRGYAQIGRKIALKGCDAACEQSWKPLLAGDSDRPDGFWTLYPRPDGKKQWAYYGYALYSPASPDVKSTEIYDDITNLELLPNGVARDMPPMHWRVAPP